MEVLLYDATSGNMLPFKVRFKRFKQFIQRNHQQTIIFMSAYLLALQIPGEKGVKSPQGLPVTTVLYMLSYQHLHVFTSLYSCALVQVYHNPGLLYVKVPSYTLLPF